MLDRTLAVMHAFWCNHVQKSMASVIVVLAGADLGALTVYQKDIAHLLGDARAGTFMSLARLVCGGAVLWRAVTAKKQ